MTKKKAEKSKLSSVAAEAERTLKTVLQDIKKDMKNPAKERVYSLTDLMKVMDRIARFEAIRNKVADGGEGSFFNDDGGADDD